MKSKYFFADKAKEIKEEVKKFEAHSESRELSKERCDHKNKVKIVGHELRCSCQAAWSGPQIETLYKLLTTSV
jgi:hypothetical protein